MQHHATAINHFLGVDSMLSQHTYTDTDHDTFNFELPQRKEKTNISI